MRAVVMLDAAPGEPVVADVPVPRPAEDELLVKVAGASVNGLDVAAASGRLEAAAGRRRPLALGRDFSGTVVAIGAGVTEFGVGEAVFGALPMPGRGVGSLAEYLTVPVGQGVARIPGGVTPRDAGVLAVAGSAALAAVEAVRPEPGEAVLVVGATGGVGSFAVQYAAQRGARVIATARPGVETQFVRDLAGREGRVVDRSRELTAQVRRLEPGGVAAVLHLAGDASPLPGLLAPGGRLASTLGPTAQGARAVTADPDAATLKRLGEDVAAGRIEVRITRTYSLGEAPTAFTNFAAGTLGKLAVSVA
ncbi:NADP-dependent oxidoreductase [Streptomyces hoynatensis]|uniref:NADP-dependent oxidoreductase n=1 Tax=Streptomyces hoynatensis TaxID=1141874 RepID=A0A3A9ZGV0_9ACTN|nr:NADP-dependent oxidoreductase [Streptomyces hoynatensis]RKN46924.1 NADP-dependent oxidoreductase [Streptomyces hoynatensis]